MAAHGSKKFEGLNLDPVATVQRRSLCSHTVKTETSPCSGQLSTPAISEPTIDGNLGDNIEEQIKFTAEGLPEDWIKEVKPQRNNFSRKNTFYVDPKTGYAFHSLEDALRYIQTGNILSCVVIPQKRSREEVLVLMNGPETRSISCPTMRTQTSRCPSQVAYQIKLSSDGLPGDWIKEVKTRKKDSNRKDWSYIDPKTGYLFRSLKDALRYVETGDILSCASKPQKRSMEKIRALSSQTTKTENAASPAQPSHLITVEKSGELVCKVVQDNQLTSYGLPKNWIKELKPRKNGSTKMDPYYIDLDTGYAFCSLKDVSRYLATGNILSCVVRPKKRSIEEVQALTSSCKMSSISGMKTVQQESLQFVQPDSLHRKRKRSPVKPPDLKPKEDLKIKGTKSATGTTSRKVKQGREEPLSVRASPRLLALKAIKADYDGNHGENNDSRNTMPGTSNSTAPPDLNRVLNSQPDPKSEEEVMAANGHSRTRLQSAKLQRERPMQLRASPRFAASETTVDITSVENKNSMMSKYVLEQTPSQPHLNRQGSHPDLEHEEETTEGASGSSTGTLLRSRKMCRERRTPLRASSRLAALKAATDESSIKHENSIACNALIESSLSSLSYQSTTLSSQPDLQPEEEKIEGANGSSTRNTSRRGKMHRERRTSLRASSRLAAQKVTTDTTLIQNENSIMSNALLEPSPSLSQLNLRPSSQPALELKEETIERANGSSTKRPVRRGMVRRERHTPLRASSRLAVQKVSNDATFVENENCTMSNALFGPLPSLSYLNLRPTSQTDLELKEETIEGANSSSTEAPLHRGKMRRERPTLLRASSRLAAVHATSDCTCVENENSVTNNALFNPSPSFSFLNMTPASQPDLELKEERIQAANGSSNGNASQKGKRQRERLVPLKASSCQPALKETTDCPSWKNEDSNVSNSVFEQPTSHPDLNLGSISLHDVEFKEVITAANGRGSRSTLQREKLLREGPATIRNSSRMSALRSTLGTTSDENNGEDNRTCNAVSELPLSPAHPDLNFGPTSQNREPKEDAINGSAIRTTSWRVEPRRQVFTSVKASPCLEALKVTTETPSSKSNEQNSMAIGTWSELSHFPGRPDLNLGPTSQLTVDCQEERADASATGTTSWTTNLHGVRPTPVIAMSEAPSYYNYQNNIKISNYFCEPVVSSASQIIMGSTSQSNPGEVWLDTTAAAPSTVIAAGKKAPDLNMVPVSWPEPEYGLESALEAKTGPKLEQLQQPAGVNIIGEFQLQPPVPSEMPYQDPTMDALLSGQEAGPSMPHMSIDTLNSPVLPFFGDFWHDPCLSYAFRTLTGGGDQQQGSMGLGPENNLNGAGAQNGGPSGNSSIGPSGATNRTPQYMNNGMPFPK